MRPLPEMAPALLTKHVIGPGVPVRTMTLALRLRLLLITGLLAASTVPAGATSKTLVAAIGDAAPGGGVFTGPGFDWPTAGGDGWVAFRSQLTGGSVTETIVVAHMADPMSQ